MAVSMLPQSQLKRVEGRGEDVWELLGDDPYFLVTYPLIRKNFVVIELKSLTGVIDPALYIPTVRGFHEHAVHRLQAHAHFLIQLEIGSIGLSNRFRLDPATEPGLLEITVKDFATTNECQNYLDLRKAQLSETSLEFVALKLPRIARRLPIKFPRPRAISPQQHLNVVYKLASSELSRIKVDKNDPIWLSIVVPTYNSEPRYLDELLASFNNQKIDGCELIFSDDGSTDSRTLDWLASHRTADNVIVQLNQENGGISAATNAGLTHTSGTWLTLLDHDDVIAPHALKAIRSTIDQNPAAQFIFTDEAIINGHSKLIGHMTKPAFDPILLSGVNYINHFSIYRRDKVMVLGGLRSDSDGSQDYDLLLRYLIDVDDHEIFHLPYPAYWWRHTSQSYSQRYLDKATRHARHSIAEHFEMQGKKVSLTGALTNTLHRVNFKIRDEDLPMISIVIPSRNGFSLISQVLRDVFEKTDYRAFEVIVVDNGSDDPAVLALYDEYREKYHNFSCHIKEEAFNFSRSVNRGFALAKGEHVLLLNNDIEVIEPNWLRELVSCLSYKNTGIVGAKLLYPNDKIQHAGVVVGLSDLAGHQYYKMSANHGGDMNRLHVRNAMTCVTGAVFLISKTCLETVGEFNEEDFAVAYNDVDYCIRAHEAGFRIVWTPFACLYHHESATRGSDARPIKSQRFKKEQEALRRIHGTARFLDPAHNPWYSRYSGTPRLTSLKTLPTARNWFG